MNKIIIVIIIAVIIGVGVSASSLSMEKTEDQTNNIEDNLVVDEIVPIEEEPKNSGRALTVELTESIGLKSP